MSLIIATGSNQGDSLQYLKNALTRLSQHYQLIAASRVYTSQAVDYEDQPDFFNQVLEFKLPPLPPEKVMETLLQIEKDLGRFRDIPKGPRTIDIDIIFWDLLTLHTKNLTLPHPRWSERSFVVRPLSELPFFQTIEKCFTIPQSYKVEATPIG